MTIQKLAIILSCLLVGALILLIVVIFCVTPSSLNEVEQKIVVEISKSLMQLIVVIIIGGAVAALFKTIEQSKKEEKEAEQRHEEENKLRTEIRVDYLSRVGIAYRNAKGTRRSLRAAGITTKFENPPTELNKEQLEIYKKEMQVLNSSQLELEALKIEAASLPALLGLQGLPNLLASMEKYLRKIVREFEKQNALLIQGDKTVDFVNLEKLSEFSGPSSEGGEDGFEARLATPHDEVIKLISENSISGRKA